MNTNTISVSKRPREQSEGKYMYIHPLFLSLISFMLKKQCMVAEGNLIYSVLQGHGKLLIGTDAWAKITKISKQQQGKR